MKELAEILGVMLAICLVVWVWFRVNLFFYERRASDWRTSRVEIQTLFHGNTKDDPNQL
jgi:hypothetical protein